MKLGILDFETYQVFTNGNEFRFAHFNKKPALRKCLSFAKKGFYTELWYVYCDGTRVLCNYWN